MKWTSKCHVLYKKYLKTNHALQCENTMIRFLEKKIGENLLDTGLDKEFMESTFNKMKTWLCGAHQN